MQILNLKAIFLKSLFTLNTTKGMKQMSTLLVLYGNVKLIPLCKVDILCSADKCISTIFKFVIIDIDSRPIFGLLNKALFSNSVRF